MNANRDLLASLFTTVKKFRKNKEFRKTIKELRRQIRLMTPVDSFPNEEGYYSTDGTKQVLVTGNMEDFNTIWVYPKDCWIDNVLDVINKKTDILYNKASDIRDADGKYYNRSFYFLLDGKVYPKDKFILVDNKAISNSKICYIGTDYTYNEEDVYVTTRGDEEFITLKQLYEMYGSNGLLSIYGKCFRTGFRLITSCLLFKGKYRLNNKTNDLVYITKQMLLDCEFSLPEGYAEAKTKLIGKGNLQQINLYCNLDKHSLINRMWNGLIKHNPNVMGCDFTTYFESYFKNLITFAKKEAEYEQKKEC